MLWNCILGGSMIKKLAALIGAIVFSAPSLISQTVPCTQVPIPCERLKLREVELQVLQNLEKENARAIQLDNPSFFQNVYADEFAGITWYGMPINKRQLVQLIQTSDEKYQSVISSNIQVKMFLDSASVLSLRTEHGIFKGKRLDRQFRVLRVYIYTPGGWEVVSQLETQLPSSVAR
jgi:Domain of unknown function (DUF4440)